MELIELIGDHQCSRGLRWKQTIRDACYQAGHKSKKNVRNSLQTEYVTRCYTASVGSINLLFLRCLGSTSHHFEFKCQWRQEKLRLASANALLFTLICWFSKKPPASEREREKLTSNNHLVQSRMKQIVWLRKSFNRNWKALFLFSLLQCTFNRLVKVMHKTYLHKTYTFLVCFSVFFSHPQKFNHRLHYR